MDDLNLAELFAIADAVGNKYLTEDEIEERQALLLAVYDEALDEGLLDD